jgi:polyisoprenoid-binding protein YceI
MSKKLFMLLGAVGLFVAGTVQATEYGFDKAHSHVGFSVKHMISMVPGDFKDFDGSFSFDEKKPESSKVKVTIQAASINTNMEKRDGHLKSADFFDVEKFPTITFVSKKVTANGDKKFKVDGSLTMHGVTKPVSLDVEFMGTDSMMGMDTIGFSATTKIDRRDFELSWGQDKLSGAGNLIVSNDVNITLDIAGTSKASLKKMEQMKKEKPADKK